MITVWNYFPTFVDYDEEDLERTVCNSVEEVLKSAPVRHNLDIAEEAFTKKCPRRFCYWSDGTEDFSQEVPMQDVLFLEDCFGKHFGAVCVKADSAKEFKEVLDALNVKFEKW